MISLLYTCKSRRERIKKEKENPESTKGWEEEIWLSGMAIALTPTDKSKTQRDNTKTPQTTSITQRLRTEYKYKRRLLQATPF